MTILHSLRVRLILVLILVTLVPVATVSILMLQATEEAFRSYSEERSISDAQSIVDQVGVETGAQVVVVGGQSGAVLADKAAPPGSRLWLCWGRQCCWRRYVLWQRRRGRGGKRCRSRQRKRVRQCPGRNGGVGEHVWE